MTKEVVAAASAVAAIVQAVLALQHLAGALDTGHPAKWCAWCP